MTIRPAIDQDLSVILQLSKQSLGEIDGMRTEEYWRWKHLKNPFGVSPVLLAFENEKLIGLRAFMQWRFAYGDKTLNAYRAVDTATHPEYQGKGIFSKLTLSLVEQLKSRAPALIFNTPNAKSMPGYLKMGWKELGKTRLRVRIFPLTILKHRLMRDSVFNEPAPFVFPDDTNELLMEWKRSHSHVVMTDYNLDYLKWRYQQIPVLKYGMKLLRSGDSTCMIIYRLKQSGSISELRLAEVVYAGNEQKKLIKTAISELAESYNPDVITVLADPDGELDSLLPFGFIKAEKRGLTITGRGVNDKALESLIGDYSRWSFSAGTLELF